MDGRERENVLVVRRGFLMASNNGGLRCGADRAEEGKERKAAPVKGTQQDEARGKVVQRRNQSFLMGSDGAGMAENGTEVGGDKSRG